MSDDAETETETEFDTAEAFRLMDPADREVIARALPVYHLKCLDRALPYEKAMTKMDRRRGGLAKIVAEAEPHMAEAAQVKNLIQRLSVAVADDD